jgi:predicted cation transporter
MPPFTSIEIGIIAGIGITVAVSFGVLIRQIIHPNDIQNTQLGRIPLKAVLFVSLVLLGLSAWILTPLLPLLALIVAARLLPIGGRAKASFLIIGALMIGLGAALSTSDLPLSQIAVLKMLGSPYQTTISGMLGP